MEAETPAYLWFLIPVLFIVFFSAMWFGITSLLGLLSGWFALQRAFPDRLDQQPVLQLRGQTGMMGGLAFMPVNFKHCLRIEACPGGLRVGVARMLGPFQKPFFVPWSSVTVGPSKALFGSYYRLIFGIPEQGALTITEGAATKLAGTGLMRLPGRTVNL